MYDYFIPSLPSVRRNDSNHQNIYWITYSCYRLLITFIWDKVICESKLRICKTGCYCVLITLATHSSLPVYAAVAFGCKSASVWPPYAQHKCHNCLCMSKWLLEIAVNLWILLYLYSKGIFYQPKMACLWSLKYQSKSSMSLWLFSSALGEQPHTDNCSFGYGCLCHNRVIDIIS